MPSAIHETLLELFRQAPGAVPRLLTDLLGVAVPVHDRAELQPADATEVVPTEYRADGVVVLRNAVVHRSVPVLDALLGTLAELEVDLAAAYDELVFHALPAAARRHLEEAMTASGTREYRSPALRRLARLGRAEGKAEGKAESVLAVLAARSVPVPDDDRVRIAGCEDLAELDRWVIRAVTATSVEDLFV